MDIALRPFTRADAEAHVAGEDAQVVRWLTGRPSSVADTLRYVDDLASAAAGGARKRAFGIWVDGRLGGYADYDPDVEDGLEPGDVNVTYAVHAWARGRGVAAAAVELLLEELRDAAVGTHAVIRVEPDNLASVRVAERAGFALVREFSSRHHREGDGSPTTLRLYRRAHHGAYPQPPGPGPR